MADGFDTSGVVQFEVEIFQDNVEPIENIIELKIPCENCMRWDMGDPDTRGHRQTQKVGSLGRHPDILHRLEQIGRNSIPGTSAKKLEGPTFSTNGNTVRGEKRGHV